MSDQHKKVPELDTSRLPEQVEEQLGEQIEQDIKKRGLNDAENRMRNRSNNSAIEGGANEKQGEPPPGYFTEAPGHQNGGKR